jgi:D-arabinose 1-dehydrogenase-like Zn-dependent alcohol dehydrogenase
MSAAEMKAAVLHRLNTKLSLNFVPIPEIHDNDVLVRIKASGICHTDLHLSHGVDPSIKLPLILGHECAGVIERVGANVENAKPGDRVICDYLILRLNASVHGIRTTN